LVQIIPDRPPKNRKPAKKVILDAEEATKTDNNNNNNNNNVEKQTIASRLSNLLIFFQGINFIFEFIFIIFFHFMFV